MRLRASRIMERMTSRIRLSICVAALLLLSAVGQLAVVPAAHADFAIIACDMLSVPGSTKTYGWSRTPDSALGQRLAGSEAGRNTVDFQEQCPSRRGHEDSGTGADESDPNDPEVNVAPRDGVDNIFNTGMYGRTRKCALMRACDDSARTGATGGFYWSRSSPSISVVAWHARIAGRSTVRWPCGDRSSPWCVYGTEAPGSRTNQRRLEWFVYPVGLEADGSYNIVYDDPDGDNVYTDGDERYEHGGSYPCIAGCQNDPSKFGTCHDVSYLVHCAFGIGANDISVSRTEAAYSLQKESDLDGAMIGREIGGSDGVATGVGMQIECRAWWYRFTTRQCISDDSFGIDYAVRFNVRRSIVMARETVAPTVSLTLSGGVDVAGEYWVDDQGTVSASATANDHETGVRVTAIAGGGLDASRDYRNNDTSSSLAREEQCLWAPRPRSDEDNGDTSSAGKGGGRVAGWTSNGVYDYSDYYYSDNPCKRGMNKTIGSSRSAASLPKGRSNPHDVTVTTQDASRNTAAQTRRFYVDPAGPPPSPACQLLSAPGTDVPAGRSLPDVWWRVSHNLTGTICDDASGIRSAQIEQSVNSGAWTTKCSNGAWSSTATNPVNMSCAVNPREYNQGDTVHFRIAYVDWTGNAGTVEMAGARRMDAAAPTVNGLTFTPALTSNRWFNTASMRIGWSQVSAGSGSPIHRVYLRRIHHGSCGLDSRDGNVAAPVDWSSWAGGSPTPARLSGSGVFELAGDATFGELRQDRDYRGAPCEQGTHTVQVWAEDVVGNMGTVTTTQQNMNFDSIPPKAVRNFAVRERDYHTQTDDAPFGLRWQNPLHDAAQGQSNATVSPLKDIRYRLAEGSVAAFAPSSGAGNCYSFGAWCPSSEGWNNFFVPLGVAGGSYPLKLWLRDEAGNSSEANADVVVIKLTDNQCIR